MQLKAVWIGIGEFFQWTFQFLTAAQNGPNFLFLGIGLILLVYWIGQMIGQVRRGEN